MNSYHQVYEKLLDLCQTLGCKEVESESLTQRIMAIIAIRQNKAKFITTSYLEANFLTINHIHICWIWGLQTCATYSESIMIYVTSVNYIIVTQTKNITYKYYSSLDYHKNRQVRVEQTPSACFLQSRLVSSSHFFTCMFIQFRPVFPVINWS